MNLQTSVAIAKDAVTVLRDGIFFGFTLWAVTHLDVTMAWLKANGITKAEIGPLKLEASVVDANAALNDAKANIAATQKNNEALVQTLSPASGAPPADPKVVTAVASLRRQTEALKATADTVDRTIARNAQVVDAVITTGVAAPAVVWSADTNLKEARYEVETRGPSQKLPNPTLYRKQGFYRSVAVIGTSGESPEEVLKRARTLQKDAYFVNMATWCPVSVQREGYLECK